MRKQCRIWWPKHLSSTKSYSSYTFLFGFFVSCASASLDIVVAFACDESSLSDCQSSLKEILCDVNETMCVILQDKSMFSLLGQCATYPSSNDQLFRIRAENNDQRKSTCGTACAHNEGMLGKRNKRCCCGCHKLDNVLEKHRLATGSKHWIQLVYNPHLIPSRDIHCIPKLHHIHWNGRMVLQCDVHVILYETPRYGSHYFSLSFWNSSKQVETLLKKPKWIDELHQKQPLNDLDTVIMAMNSATVAKMVLERHVGSKRHFAKFSIICMLLALVWQLLAVSIASLSTVFYIFLQFLHRLLSFGSQSWMYTASERIFNTAWINIQIRCGQILYWPILLQDNDLRSRSCVEYAEKAALHKHSMWSSLAVDALLGNLVFKLNTEYAGVLGMISLNAIQMWSTLWFFMDSLLIYFVKGLAILGILFGMTVPAALVRDMILLVTLHASTIHWVISVLYSQQIQALAALWRLFRGLKWNPLQQRPDSYEYTVKQHIIGSLLFTPLLLLLPTTSVFYIFFTVTNLSISLVCMLIKSLYPSSMPRLTVVLYFGW